ncbi:MAG: Pvc16 family protein [Myxococcota bacterium]
MERVIPEGFAVGPNQGDNVIGEVTESLQRFLLDGWPASSPPPRIEEDLSFVPKDREEVIYIYMYRLQQNDALRNPKRYRTTPFSVPDHEHPENSELFYEWPPLFIELYYMVSVHSKFRSDAERLLGWVMMRLHHATHLLYRPRRYVLPDARVVDSAGADWGLENIGEDLVMEKVALSLVDDFTVGDAINFFTIHEAPYRPYATYQARCAVRGPLVSAPPTIVRTERLETIETERPAGERANGRKSGRMATRPTSQRQNTIGPAGYGLRPTTDNNEEG